jgi:hypothetical protein
MSLHSNFEFKDFVPKVLYQKYFDVMANNDTVYVCLIQNENQIGSIYLESPRENAEDVEGVIRVFFDIDSLRKYGRSVSLIEGIPFEFVRRWEMSFSNLVDYVSKMDARYKQAERKGVRAIASSYHGDKFVDLDILWTAERKFMV